MTCEGLWWWYFEKIQFKSEGESVMIKAEKLTIEMRK